MFSRLMILGSLGLAACTNPMNPAPFSDGVSQSGIALTEAFGDTPLDDGPIRILVQDADPLQVMRTFTLAPCRNNTEVCGGSENGPVGQSSIIDGQYVVANAYPGLTFFLDRNGDGFLQERGQMIPLAWD
ncbi:hypothetical protein [Loktanella sp. 3ANDIMAR09]|uniref:hypothetical protein n=1 Tax=Loktanella sp. 3ANDIMAR09 TaxID=1225657 RepID=UPI0006F3C917|nr:hypothetical protein [Loktanella sp. 3ANDIMAR09]